MTTRVTFPNKRMSSIIMAGGIREILGRADELEREGRSIIHMEIGRPDFDSPECAKEATIKAIREGNVHYTDMSGPYDLRCAIADKYRKEHNMDVDPNKHVVVTCGATEALTATFLTLLEPDEEVIVLTPYFPGYADEIALACGKLAACCGVATQTVPSSPITSFCPT